MHRQNATARCAKSRQPRAFLMRLGRGAGCPGKAIAECEALIDVIADRLDAAPTGLDLAKQVPRQIAQVPQ